MSDSNPVAGWYPDPQDPVRHRYWDGAQWTAHVFPEVAPPAAPVAPVAVGPYTAYAPASSELTASGMRRLPELFSDIGRILKRGWWPLLGLGLVLWSLWLLLTVALSSLVVDLRRFAGAFDLIAEYSNRYPNGRWPAAAESEIADAFRGVLRFDSPLPYVIVALVLVVVTVAVTAAHTAAVTRISMEAAAGRAGLWSAGWSSAWTGGRRLFGYLVVLLVIVAAVTAAIVGLIALTIQRQQFLVLAVLGIVLVIVVGAVVGLWLTGRLIPVVAQVDVAPGALRWSWAATRSKFWAVLGRYLLWGIIASVLAQVVSSLVAVPFSLVAVIFSANPGSFDVTWFAVLYLVGIPLTMALGALTYVGVVPIWRDLTDRPEYAAIDAEGHVVAPAA